ncbi:MAG TPA: hypothetical protein VHI72_18300, partial [Hyphomicrobiaceae bacterium]|nr:hypothetical protein [Hyphomicrobiaceae bacterium]
MENQPSAPVGGLLQGGAAYQAQTPWGAVWAILGAALITLAGILAAVSFVGVANLSTPAVDGEAQGQVALATLGVWQVTTIALTVLASALFGGRIKDVLALGAPPAGASVYLSAIGAMLALQLVVSVVQYFL